MIRRSCLCSAVTLAAVCLGICLTLVPSAARSAEAIRIAVADNQKTVTLTSPSGFADLAGFPASADTREMVVTAAVAGSRPLRIRPKGAVIALNGRRYRGWMEIRKKKNGLLLVVNELDLEDYLKSVVPSEMPHTWKFEAIEAQAVASRTYALYRKRHAGTRPYDLLATQDSQVYDGIRSEQASADHAVDETRGIVIVYQGEIIPAFYHSSCGGHTANAEELWGIDEPYLKGVDCDCQAISKYGQWERRIGKEQIIRALRREGHRITDIITMRIGALTTNGRVKDLIIRHPGGSLRVKAEPLRAALGNDLLPSVFYELQFENGTAVFSGRGRGHGVGLCQWGAERMAEEGHGYMAILAHYYPGVDLLRLY